MKEKTECGSIVFMLNYLPIMRWNAVNFFNLVIHFLVADIAQKSS